MALFISIDWSTSCAHHQKLMLHAREMKFAGKHGGTLMTVALQLTMTVHW